MIMKKAFSIIALCMVIILCIPAVPAFAEGEGFKMRTLQSTRATGHDALIMYDTSFTNQSISDIYNFYNRLNVNLDDFTYYIAYYMGGSDTQFKFIGFYDEFEPQIYYYQFQDENEYNGGSRFSIVCPNSPALNSNNVYKWYWMSGSQWANDSWSNSGYSSSLNIRFMDCVGAILDTNIHVSFIDDINVDHSLSEYSTAYHNGTFANAPNHFPDTLPYVDSDGNIVNPSSSFSDTAYNGGIAFNYQQTHLYTQYNNAQGANETCVFKWALDERSRSITQTTNDWKMHYYVIVNWHWTQATDSSVYTPLLSGGSGGQMAFEFDSEPDLIMQGQTEISIWDLVQHVPTISSVSDEDIVSLAVAVSCLNGNIVNSVWRDIFGQSGQYVGDVASEIISGGKLEVQGVGEFGGSFINNLFNPAYYYALDDLRIKLVAHPWSGSKNIHGGNGDFDLNLRSNDSYGTTQGYVDDGGTPDDPSDDTQYPTNIVPQQNNVVVPVTYPTSGGNVTVYSVVQVPDSGGGSSNSINYSPTFSPSIVMDSGLDDLKETVDAYPQVPNKNFWDYFLVFKDNAFLDATSDFFGALPNELSSLLISSIGIIGVFAIYRFVRRR